MGGLKRLFFIVFGFIVSSGVLAERYMVAEDSFGGFSAEPAEPAKQEKVRTSDPDVTTPQENISTQPLVKKNVGTMPDDQVEKAADRKIDNKKLSIFERTYLESERKAKEAVLESIAKEGAASSGYDATEVNPVNFVDGDELVKTGGREEDEKAPYFITIDASGNLQNTFYDPVLVSEALEKQRNTKIEYTQARVYERTDQREDENLNLPESADPIAAQLLNSGNKELELYFDAFSKRCCSMLPNIIVPTIEMGRSQAFKISDDDLYYRFSEGDSRFLLFGLPSEMGQDYPLRIRTFIRSFKKKSIEHGVFFPQIITLDSEKRPLRILTGPLLKYQSETWTTHGYLEGVFQINRSEEKDERYVLINTTNDVLRQTSTIESEEPIEIAHMSVGSFEIEAIVED